MYQNAESYGGQMTENNMSRRFLITITKEKIGKKLHQKFILDLQNN